MVKNSFGGRAFKMQIQSHEETIKKLRSKIESLSSITDNNKVNDNEVAAKCDNLPQDAKSLISSADAGTSPMKAALRVGDMDRMFHKRQMKIVSKSIHSTNGTSGMLRKKKN